MASKRYKFFRNITCLNSLLFVSLATSSITFGASLAIADNSNFSVLKTPSFQVRITINCKEGVVVCNNVTYLGTSLKTGKSIKISGKSVHTLCADRVTPCRFLGYEFRNKQYLYSVSEDGLLEIYRNQKLVTSEQGTWEP